MKAPEKYSIFDEMIEGVQIVNSDWQYVYVNNTVAAHGKYPKEELLGYTMMEKYPGIETTAMFENIQKCFQEKKHVQMINEFSFPDGSTGYFELRMEPIPEGVLILSFDVTKQKQAEFFLKNNNALLEEKVNQRTKELLMKNKELEQFAYIASHDLQEPIRTVSNYIQVLKEDHAHNFDADAQKYLEVIHQANHRMSKLTAALLDYSRLGRNKEKTTVDLSKLIKEVLVDLQGTIKAAGARIDVGALPTMKVYEVETRQLFQNLLTNAIKFRKTSVIPEIAITAQPVDSGWLFSVKDNGIGIAKAHYERIFDIFQRLHQKEAYEGTGIGLANCKKIVELHQGNIHVESIVDEGSTFSFTLSTND